MKDVVLSEIDVRGTPRAELMAKAFNAMLARMTHREFGLTLDESIVAMRAAIAALPAGGFAIVPVVPSPEAVAAWHQSRNGGGSDYDAYGALVHEAARVA
jgi:hypothetical protein